MNGVTITEVRIPPGKPDRRVVCFEDGTVLRLPARVVRENGLESGRVVPDVLRSELQQHHDLLRIRVRALRLLAVRARTEEELRRTLLRTDVAPGIVETVLDELRGGGAIDDEAFAQAFADERRRRKKHAPARIEADLRRRGIARETARAAARDTYGAGEEAEGNLFDTALALLQRRYGRYAGLSEAAAGRRLAGLLNRAGYPAATALDAVHAVLETMRREGLISDEEEPAGA